MRTVKWVLLILVIILFMLVGMWVVEDNPAPIALSLFGFPMGEKPVGVLVLFIFALGVLAGLALSSIPLMRSKLALRRCRKQLLAVRLVLNKQAQQQSQPQI